MPPQPKVTLLFPALNWNLEEPYILRAAEAVVEVRRRAKAVTRERWPMKEWNAKWGRFVRGLLLVVWEEVLIPNTEVGSNSFAAQGFGVLGRHPFDSNSPAP